MCIHKWALNSFMNNIMFLATAVLIRKDTLGKSIVGTLLYLNTKATLYNNTVHKTITEHNNTVHHND